MKCNLAHILRIGEISTILGIIAHWGNKYYLAEILRIYCALDKEVQSWAYIMHKERILHKSCALTKESPKLRKYCTSNVQLPHLAQNRISPLRHTVSKALA